MLQITLLQKRGSIFLSMSQWKSINLWQTIRSKKFFFFCIRILRVRKIPKKVIDDDSSPYWNSCSSVLTLLISSINLSTESFFCVTSYMVENFPFLFLPFEYGSPRRPKLAISNDSTQYSNSCISLTTS